MLAEAREPTGEAAPAAPAPLSPTAPRWTLAQRVALRFLVAYFALFFLTDRVADILPQSELLTRKYAELWLPVVTWVGRHLFGGRYEIYILEGGQGVNNSAFGTILFLCYLAVAALATLIWSALDRRREHYRRLHQWLRLLLRASLGLAMLTYGLFKAIPTQMISPPPLGMLELRVGDLTPMQMLWTFVGASPAYESFTGCAELLGGLLLLSRRTTLLGALVCAADMVMVVALNFCYDVHVKLYSLHLLAMALLLIAPDLPRLADLFLRNRRVEPAPPPPPLFARKAFDRIPQLVFLLLALYTIGVNWPEVRERYYEWHPPRPLFFGVWTVERFVVEGKEVPLYTAPDRWRSVRFQRPGAATVELMIGARRGYSLALDLRNRRMKLGPPPPPQTPPPGMLPRQVPGPPAQFSFAARGEDQLILDGQLGGRATHMELRRMPLLQTGFHWIFDPPKEDR